jgi:Transposase IS4
MSLERFRQVRSSFHPEDKSVASMGEQDKCYQLRHAINTFNVAALNMRHIPGKLSFDEGGCACRSRFCPVRQYNKDKPDKFRVDFFILACPKTYYIHHMDVYQGKNASNVGIKPEARCLPTTQKAVLNAVLQTRIANDPNGLRLIAMDNQYGSCELTTILRGRYGVYVAATSRINRKGWPSELSRQNGLNKTKDARGSYKLMVDKTNKVQCLQWVDSKVVNAVTSLLSSEITFVHRQKGSQKIRYDCPMAMRMYQLWMLGVDKGDQMKAHWGGFSRKAHFKKWYKKIYLSILDAMILNGLVVWNDSALDVSLNRPTMKRHEFYQYCAQRMMSYPLPDRKGLSPSKLQASRVTTGTVAHVPLATRSGIPCVVCRLETGAGLGGNTISMVGLYTNVVNCSHCQIGSHNCIPITTRKLHAFPEWKGMTCFQILHTQSGEELWKRRPGEKTNYAPQQSNPLYQQLREEYNKTKIIGRKRSADGSSITGNTMPSLDSYAAI